MSNQEKPSLMVHEWLAIATIIGFLGMLTMISVSRSTAPLPVDTETPHHIIDPFITVSIAGAVELPGSYKVKKGALIQEVLEQAKVLPEADLKRININAKLRNGQSLYVTKIEQLTIYIQGAVQTPGPVLVPKGTRLIDLAKFAAFNENANLKPLQKQRRLKNNEVIHVGTINKNPIPVIP